MLVSYYDTKTNTQCTKKYDVSFNYTIGQIRYLLQKELGFTYFRKYIRDLKLVEHNRETDICQLDIEKRSDK